MIYLYASSSNEATILPEGSYSNGSAFLIKFVDGFSKDEYIAQATGSKSGNWYNIPIELTSGSYVIGVNESRLPLIGGTYDAYVYSLADFGPQWDTEDEDWDVEAFAWDDAFAAYSVYGTELRQWIQMGDTWSSIPGIPTTTGNAIMTTRAFVSESIGRDIYSSTNENAAFVVYEG